MELRLAAFVGFVVLGLGTLALVTAGGRGVRVNGEACSVSKVSKLGSLSCAREVSRSVDEGVDQLLPAPGVAAGRRALQPSASSAADPAASRVEDPIWLSISFQLPEGLPADDRPVLLALSRRTHGQLGGPQVRRLASAIRTSQPLEHVVARYLACTPHPAETGVVRVPFEGGTENALVLLRSRYLYLLPAELDPRSDAQLELAPALGGYVAGRCTLPREAHQRGVRGRNVAVELAGTLSNGLSDLRRAECDEDGCFELWGLVPEVRYTLVARARSLLHVVTKVYVKPGLRHELEIMFEPGGVVRGVVVDGDGLAVQGARVSLENWREGGAPRAESDEQGCFELVGVPEGEASLIVHSALGTAHATLSIQNGDIWNGLRLGLTQESAARGAASRCGEYGRYVAWY